MKPNNNQSRMYRPNRWARLKKQLTQARAEADRYKRKFEVEKTAKNKAYCFILECGYYEAFYAWRIANRETYKDLNRLGIEILTKILARQQG